jgi:hypothetical protein
VLSFEIQGIHKFGYLFSHNVFEEEVSETQKPEVLMSTGLY